MVFNSVRTEARKALDVAGWALIPNLIPDEALSHYEQAIRSIYEAQANKLPRVLERRHGYSGDPLTTLLKAFEYEDHEAGYQAYCHLRLSPAAWQLTTTEPLLELVSGLLHTPETALLLYGPDLLYRLPARDGERLMYHWHTERPYYPKRRRFIKVWIPLFQGKDKLNGTMAVRPGSHHRSDRQFAEFRGYGGQEGSNAMNQIVLPESELDDCPHIQEIEAPRGSVVLLHPDIVHGSVPNSTNQVSMVTVALYFDTSKDLTISGNPSLRLYNFDQGRHDLRV